MAQFILSAFADEAAADLKGQIAALKRNGIDCIEIRNIDGKCVIDYSEEEISAFKAELDAAGIRVSSLGSPIGKYEITDDFEPHFDRFKKAVKTAQLLGTKNMRMFSFFIPDGKTATDYSQEVYSRLTQMLAYAKAEGIQLCHENEARIYGRRPEEALELQEQLPDLKAIFDPANYIMENADITWAIDRIAPYLEYLHIKDACLEDHKIVPAGYGDGKIVEVLEKAAAARGSKDTYLTVEPHLFAFTGYSNLDHREMKHKFSYANQNESFDAAVNALKTILNQLGYKKGENNKWKK